MRDQVLRLTADVYCWDGPKPKLTLAGAEHGTLVLTEGHLLFRTIDAYDMRRRVDAVAVSTARAAEPVEDGADLLDLPALLSTGGFVVPLSRVDEVRSATRWDRSRYLSVRLRDGNGAPLERSLMHRMSMPDVEGWARSIVDARTAASG
jgi:hypothetical protein